MMVLKCLKQSVERDTDPELPPVQNTLVAQAWEQDVAFESRAAVVQTLYL